MRVFDNQSKVTGRRFFLMALAAQPFIINSLLENPLKKMVLNVFQDDDNDLFIIGGWVLLKSDV